MEKIRLVKPKIKNSNKLNTDVSLYAYTREGGGSNLICKPPVVNSICGFRNDK